MGHICREDYPERWPDLLDSIHALLKSGDYARMHAALLGLHKLCSKYAMKKQDERKPLDKAIVLTFPLLRELFQQLLSSHNSLEAGEMIKLICKIYFKCIQFHLPEFIKQQDEALKWAALFKGVLDKQLPEASSGLEPRGQPVNIEEREKWPWWKAKKHAARVVERLFQRYGIPGYATEEDMDFAALFSSGPNCIALLLLPSILGVLERKAKGNFCTDVVFRLCLTFLSNAVSLSVTFKVLIPHLPFVIKDVLIPALCWSERDLRVWQEDPVQLVRDKFSFGYLLNIGSNPEDASACLLEELCFTRTRYSLKISLDAISNSISAYESNKQSFELAIKKSGALRGLEALAKILQQHPVFQGQLEEIIMKNLVPELSSPIPALRISACKCAAKFVEVPWTNQQNEILFTQSILRLMADPDLPVRVQTGCALITLLKRGSPVMLNIINSVLHDIVQGYLNLLREIAVDELFEALQALIERFSNKMGPMTNSLLQNLTQAFMRYYSEDDDEDDEYAETSMAVVDCIQAVNQLLIALGEGENSVELVRAATPTILPIIHTVFRGGEEGKNVDTMDYLQSVLETIRIITYHGKFVPTQLWQYVPEMYKIFTDWAIDYVVEFSGTLENLIQYDPNAFLSVNTPENAALGKSNLEVVLSLAETALDCEEIREEEKIYAVVMLQILTQSCLGKIDAVLPKLVTLALRHLSKATDQVYIINLLCLVESALFYNPHIALAAIGVNDVPVFFELVLQNLESHYAYAEQKIALFSLCSILRVSPKELPDHINQIRSLILTKVVSLFASIEEIKAAIAEHKKEKEEDTKKKDEFGYKSTVKDEGDEEAFLQARGKDVPEDQDVAEAGSLIAPTGDSNELSDPALEAALAQGRWDNESDILDSDDDEDVESPLDRIDEYVFLHQAVSTAPPEAQQVSNRVVVCFTFAI